MAYISLTREIADNFISEDIEAMLNELIETELNKAESQVNTKLVDECVEALLTLEAQKQNGFNAFVPILPTAQFVRTVANRSNRITVSTWKRMSKTARAVIIAAILACSTITANAAIEAVTDVNVLQEVGNALENKLREMGVLGGIEVLPTEDEEETTKHQGVEIIPVEDDDEETTTSPTTTTTKPQGVEIIPVEDDDDETTTTTKPQGIEIIPVEDDDEETTNPVPATKPNKPVEPTTAEPVTIPQRPERPTEVQLVALKAEFDNFKTDYVYGEELSYDGLTLTAIYSNGSTKSVSLDECSVTTSIDMNVTADYTLRIIYQTCVVTVDITVRPDEDTRGSEICSNDDFDYLLTQKGAYLTKYKGNEKNVTVNTIDGNDVVCIGADVFGGADIESVYAQNVIKIFANAFKNCTELVDCYTPRAEYIGDSSFENCSKLKEAVFSDNATYIGERAYRNTAIESFTLPQGIDAVPNAVCEGCKSLKTVELLSKPSEIGANAFAECTALEVLSGAENIKIVGDYAFFDDEILAFDAKPEIVSVGDGSFAFCKNIDFGEQLSLEKIGMQSFLYCTNLTSVKLKEGITVIPYNCFKGCHIESIEIPEGVTEIEDYALMSTAMRSITLPSTLEKIGTYGVYATMLREVHFRSMKTQFGASAFYRGSRLTFYAPSNSDAYNYAVENNIQVRIEEVE